MGLGRYMVDAVVLEGRKPSELAKAHGISQSWIYRLVDRFRRGGYPALEPKSRRPHSSPRQGSPQVQAAVVELRHELFVAGHGPRAQSIAPPLVRRVDHVPSGATI